MAGSSAKDGFDELGSEPYSWLDASFAADLLSAAPVVVVVLDLEGRVEHANPFFEALAEAEGLFGWSRAELVGASVDTLVPADRRDAHARHRERFLASPAVRSMSAGQRQLEARCKDGSAIPVEVSLGPLRSGDGPQVIVVIRDIRERLRIESERRSLETQLRHSQKMESLGLLASGIAHDFNNLLAVITGNVECLQREVDHRGAAAARLDALAVAAARASDVVQRILALSRSQPSKRHLTGLAEIVREVVTLVRPTLPAAIRLEVEIATDAPAVLADPTHLHQVILNLVTNAWHAFAGRPGTITIRIEKGESIESPVARLIVADDGHGISPAIIERIFDPFFSTKAAGEGSGLGLSVVHGIVKEHGGVIAVESALGAGATFSIELPAAPSAGVGASTEAAGDRGHVLFLDDDELIVSIGEALLQRLGYTASGYSRAVDAIEAIRAEPRRFDVVVTDYWMPEMSGIEVAREIADICPWIPVVIVTGSPHASREIAAAGLRHCICIGKPFKLEELGEALMRARGAEPIGEEDVTPSPQPSRGPR